MPPETHRPAPAPPARHRRVGSGNRGPGRPAPVRSHLDGRRSLRCPARTAQVSPVVRSTRGAPAVPTPDLSVRSLLGAGTMPPGRHRRPADSVPDGDRRGPRPGGLVLWIQSARPVPLRLYREYLPVTDGRRPLRRPEPGPHRLGGGLLGGSPVRSPGGAGQGARRGPRGDGPLRDRPAGPSQSAADRGNGHRCGPGHRHGPAPHPRGRPPRSVVLAEGLHAEGAGSSGERTRPPPSRASPSPPGSMRPTGTGPAPRWPTGPRRTRSPIRTEARSPATGPRPTELGQLAARLTELLWPWGPEISST